MVPACTKPRKRNVAAYGRANWKRSHTYILLGTRRTKKKRKRKKKRKKIKEEEEKEEEGEEKKEEEGGEEENEGGPSTGIKTNFYE